MRGASNGRPARDRAADSLRAQDRQTTCTLPVALTVSAFFALTLTKVVQARRKPPSVGPQMIVGAHGLHALMAIVALTMAWWRLRIGTLTDGFLFGTETFWYFVVLLWPIIYARVYF